MDLPFLSNGKPYFLELIYRILDTILKPSKKVFLNTKFLCSPKLALANYPKYIVFRIP
jgi:hypothetical protein